MTEKPMSLGEAILEVAQKYGKIKLSNGIVTVTQPNGEIWDFTIPMVVRKETK